MRNNANPSNLIPAHEWPKHHHWPPIGGLRHLIYNAKSNGFDQVVRRVGRRVLIDEAAFFDWVRAHSPQIATAKPIRGGV